MKIITGRHYHQGPSRAFDWSAVTDTYDESEPVGFGPTEAEAIEDLRDQLHEADNLTSFPPITDKESDDIKAWYDFDHASIYAR